jgi:4-carboxymuconolactone decarboxylase
VVAWLVQELSQGRVEELRACRAAKLRQRQILICVSGRGWYQEWGKAPVALTPGTVIDIPEGVKHWHGSQRDSWFQHYTTHVATGGEQSNEWLEPVTDEVYDKLK